jgi:hypothetical protein
MSDERKLTEEDREKIQRLLESGTFLEDVVLTGLPGCFYAVAVLVGIALGITTIAVMSKGGNGELVCYLIGYTIGGVLSILATGRLIELVGRISDDVRTIRERTDSQK